MSSEDASAKPKTMRSVRPMFWNLSRRARSSYDATPMEKIFAERLKTEHEILAQRTTWLMTLNSFLVGAVVLLAVNTDRIFWPVLAISILGTFSNGSVLFSNWWGTRSIHEAADVLAEWWEKEDMPVKEKETRRLRMRLYGRDPRSFLGYRKSSPSEWLHPWLLLPALFSTAFMVMPAVETCRRACIAPEGLWAAAPLIAPISFVALIVWDLVRRAEADRWILIYGDPPEVTHSVEEAPIYSKKTAKRLHRDRRKQIEHWLAETTDRSKFEKVRLKKPRFWHIPHATHVAWASRFQNKPARSGDPREGR